jgi:hypothetical protein
MPDERYIIAVHECGHCCTALALGKPAHSLELTPQGGGEFREHTVAAWEPRDEQGRKRFRDAVLASYKPTDHDRDEVWPLLLISFGGICAQRRYCGTAAPLFEHLGEFDQRQRDDLAKAVTESPAEAQAFLNMAQTEASWIINHSWAEVTLLADELALRGKLDADDIQAVIELGPAARRRRHWEQLIARAEASGITLVPRGV